MILNGIINIWANRMKIWKKMRIIWNQGPKRINKASKISNDVPSTVKTPPPYDTAIVTGPK